MLLEDDLILCRSINSVKKHYFYSIICIPTSNKDDLNIMHYHKTVIRRTHYNLQCIFYTV